MFQFSQAFRDEFGANWRVLAIAITALFFGFSAPAYALPFIYPEVIDDFGWTREQATSLATAAPRPRRSLAAPAHGPTLAPSDSPRLAPSA